jgi:hypothetical protein
MTNMNNADIIFASANPLSRTKIILTRLRLVEINFSKYLYSLYLHLPIHFYFK